MPKQNEPLKHTSLAYHFDYFTNGQVLEKKKKGKLPVMGWNSWNAFGSNNTEELTMAMADCMVELGLKELGYRYVVLDDGCYLPERVNGRLANEPVKFSHDFSVLAEYIHGKGLKFGMYNDIGTNLCAGAAVGTCGHEAEDARSYVDWGVDFLKVDNCYYLWDNATFSHAANAKYVYAPRIQSVKVFLQNSDREVSEPVLNFSIEEDEFVSLFGENGIGTYDGTGPERTPLGKQAQEIELSLSAPEEGTYRIEIVAVCDEIVGCGSWLQLKVESPEEDSVVPYLYDGFYHGESISCKLEKGSYRIRIMNHRRQENTLMSYGKLLASLNEASPDHDILLSICEWGKTQPQNWGYKVGDSWRILNDITFQVGSEGNPGNAAWTSEYTTSVTSQYNKAVIMDGFAGIDKGWNDPDMLMIGMNGLDMTMNRTHMTMWCMMNAPLMLGLDLRRVKKGDEIYSIIANKQIIALNQDSLGMQAKRVAVYRFAKGNDSEAEGKVQKILCLEREYIRDNNRVDILVKPLANDSIAISFINLSDEKKEGPFFVSMKDIYDVFMAQIRNDNQDSPEERKRISRLSFQLINSKLFWADCLHVTNLWTGENYDEKQKRVEIKELLPHDQVTLLISFEQSGTEDNPDKEKREVDQMRVLIEKVDPHFPKEGPVLRKQLAKALHAFIRDILCVPDITDQETLKEATKLKDLYDCRTCVNDIMQVYVRGIMKEKHYFPETGMKLFGGNEEVPDDEMTMTILNLFDVPFLQ